MSEETDKPAAWHYARDGHKTGPVPFDVVRELARSGGLQPGDLVWTAGMPQWSPAGAVPALAGAFGRVAPPPLPGAAGQYAPGAGPFAPPRGVPLGYASPLPPPGYPGGPPPGIGDDAGIRWLIPVGRSGWAIAAGYLGLLSVLGCPGPIALVISIIALRDLRRNPRLHGMGRAIFGLVMGGLGTLALAWLLVGRAFA